MVFRLSARLMETSRAISDAFPEAPDVMEYFGRVTDITHLAHAGGDLRLFDPAFLSQRPSIRRFPV